MTHPTLLAGCDGAVPRCLLHRFAITACFACLLTPLAHAQGGVEESADACEIAIATGVGVLPPPLRAFFEPRLEDVRYAANAQLPNGATGKGQLEALAQHYIMLDIASDGGDPSARLAAARAFPRKHDAARKLFRRHGKSDGGSLPWTILRHYKSLVAAMSAGREDAIVREVGALFHFVTDAALPFNTTVDRNGALCGCVRWPAEGKEGGIYLRNRTVRHRFHIALMGRLRQRFEHEVRVAPGRFDPLVQPIEAVFEALVAAHDDIEKLRAIDMEATTALDIVDDATFIAKTDTYHERVTQRAASIMETRLEQAALLGANLVGAAWVAVGRPPPNDWRVPAAPSKTAKRVESKREGAFVGSRTSKVFHRATCPHAGRIRPENLIRYKTAEQALNIGRQPCKTCRPDQP